MGRGKAKYVNAVVVLAHFPTATAPQVCACGGLDLGGWDGQPRGSDGPPAHAPSTWAQRSWPNLAQAIQCARRLRLEAPGEILSQGSGVQVLYWEREGARVVWGEVGQERKVGGQ